MREAIIVADDSMIVQNIIEKALSDEYVVLKANNGMEAVNYVVSNTEYNIVGVLLDLNMPEFDGFTVLDYFKNNRLFDKYPVAIISGDDTKETIDRAFTYSIVDLLNKPFSADNVKNVINKMKNMK